MSYMLGGETLPSPAVYKRPRVYRGSMVIKANGQVGTDLLSASPKHGFYLEWKMLSSTDFDTVQDAFDLVALASQTFVDDFGDSYTVTLDPAQAELAVEWVPYRAGTPRANTSISLREV